MPHKPSMFIIEAIARDQSIRRPNYEVDRVGQVIDEHYPDRKPYGWTHMRPRTCSACSLPYPTGPLCGYCWALVRQIDAIRRPRQPAPVADEADIPFIVDHTETPRA